MEVHLEDSYTEQVISSEESENELDMNEEGFFCFLVFGGFFGEG